MAKGYAKIYRRLWDDEVFQTLSAQDKLAVLYLLTRCSNRVGIFVVQLAELAAEVVLEEREPESGFAPGESRVGVSAAQAGGETVGRLATAFRWPWHQPTRTLWIRSWWKWNPPESPSAVKGYLAELSELPRSPVLDEYVKATPEFNDSLKAAWREAVVSLRAACATPCRHPEPEPDPEPEKKKPPCRWRDAFAAFWTAYPHWKGRSHRKPAIAAWDAIQPKTPEMAARIMAGLETAKASPDWLKDRGQFIEAAERWLRRAGWDSSDGVPIANGHAPPSEGETRNGLVFWRSEWRSLEAAEHLGFVRKS